MLVAPIVDEFSDYRARVSHDLCKQRLLIRLSDIRSAATALIDPQVWPLLRDETRKMLMLGPTLFGLISPLFAEATARAEDYLARIEAALPNLEGGLEHGLVELRAAAGALGVLLSQMGDQMRERVPGFSERAVISYLAGRESLTWAEGFCRVLGEEVLSCLQDMGRGGGRANRAYARFWGVSAEAELGLRCVAVASAAEDIWPKDVGLIRRGRAILGELAQVASAWSPAVAENARPRAVADALARLGFESLDEFLRHAEETCRQR